MPPPRAAILPPELLRLVHAELRPGEKLVWSARPIPRLYWRRELSAFKCGLILVTVTSLFAGIAVRIPFEAGWAGLHERIVSSLLFTLAAYLLATPWRLARQARHVVYMVTDRRTAILRPKRNGRVDAQSFEPARLTSMAINERSDGDGDLIFETFVEQSGSGSTTVRRGFFGVENVRSVEGLIRTTLLRAEAK